jgi:LysM repeat protein
MHRVAQGDTLATIGKRYNVTPSAIIAANHKDSSQAEEGDRLLIPAAAKADAPVRKPAVAPAARRRSTPAHRTTTATTKKPAPKAGSAVARATN